MPEPFKNLRPVQLGSNGRYCHASAALDHSDSVILSEAKNLKPAKVKDSSG